MASTALAVRPHGELPAPSEWQLMVQMGDGLFRSGLLPGHIRSAQGAVAVIQKGRELGVPPMHALCSIVVIQGKPTASAELMLALIYRDHGDEAFRLVETTNERCTAEFRRRGWKEASRYTFTIQDAETAGLTAKAGESNWKKYPAAMLRARCISAAARMAFPDTIGGMYTPDELGAQMAVDDEGVLSVVGEVVEEPPARPRYAVELAEIQGLRVEPNTPTPIRPEAEFVVRPIPQPLDLWQCRHWLGNEFCDGKLVTETVRGVEKTPDEQHTKHVEAQPELADYPVCRNCMNAFWKATRGHGSWTIETQPVQDREAAGSPSF
jgi:hypothetical protein